MTKQLSTDDTLRRIRGEYREMPGLRLTMAQAQRLWSLDCGKCQMLLRALVEEGFLWRNPDGAFLRCDCSSPVQSHSEAVDHEACCEPERRQASAEDCLQGIAG